MAIRHHGVLSGLPGRQPMTQAMSTKPIAILAIFETGNSVEGAPCLPTRVGAPCPGRGHPHFAV